jgi:hypothetical protein
MFNESASIPETTVRLMDWLGELNVALWSDIIPLWGVFRCIGFKRGGSYDLSGRKRSTVWTTVSLMFTALFSYFFVRPFLHPFIEALCTANPTLSYLLVLLSVLTM